MVKRTGLIVFVLCLVCCISRSRYLMAQQSSKFKGEESTLKYKKITLGLNIGYLSDLNKSAVFREPLKRIRQDGIMNLRVYEPFTTKMEERPELKYQLLKQLVDDGFHILLSLSNFPTNPESLKKYRLNARLKKDAANLEMLSYTNRYPPLNIVAYKNYLQQFVATLRDKGLLKHLSFEIGNEPNAKKYFWGTFNDFQKIYSVDTGVLLKTNQPVYCCAFTFKALDKNIITDPYSGMLNKIKNKVHLSFHYYPNNDVSLDMGEKLNNYNGSAITEFNLYSYQVKKLLFRSNKMNSSDFVTSFVKLLSFTYQNDVSSVYVFKLIDMSKNEGTLGLFSENGQPKPAYFNFLMIKRLVSKGYLVIKNDDFIQVFGMDEVLVLSIKDNSSYKKGEKTIIKSSNTGAPYSGILNKNEWIVLQK